MKKNKYETFSVSENDDGQQIPVSRHSLDDMHSLCRTAAGAAGAAGEKQALFR